MDRFDPFVKYADVYGDIINWEKDPMNKPQNQNKYFFSDGKTYYEQICKMLRLMSVFKEAFNQIYSNEDEISEAWENFVNNLSASVVEGSEPDVTLTWTDDSVNFEFTMVPGVPGEQGVGITSISFNSDYTMTITLSDGNSYTSMSLKGETGPQGPQGETGSGLQILDVYATLADLQSAHPTGQPGDAYQVGSAENYILYIWSSSQSAWVQAGTLGTVSPYTSAPLMDGTASPGSQNLYARGDHVHPSDTSRASKEELDALIKISQSLIDQSFTYRESPAIQDGLARIDKIKGNTLVWNQLAKELNSTNWLAVSATVSYSDGICTLTPSGFNGIISADVDIIVNHKYLMLGDFTNADNQPVYFYIGAIGSYNAGIRIPQTSVLTRQSMIYTATETGKIYVRNNSSTGVVTIKNLMLIDLTQMFGAGNEPTTVDDFTSLFPLSYYPYDSGSLLSFNGNGIKTVGKNKLLFADGTRTGTGVTGTVSNGVFSATGTATSTYANLNYFNTIDFIENGKQYTVGLNAPIGYSIVFRFATDTTDTTYQQVTVSANSQFTTFTANNDYKYVRLYISSLTSGTVVNISDMIPIIVNGQIDSFEPYTESTTSLPTLTYFPTGMKSAGSVYDELTPAKAIARIGAVDLGSLGWYYNTSSSRFITTVHLTDAKRVANNNEVPNMVCPSFETVSLNVSADTSRNKTIAIGSNDGNLRVRDSSFTDATAFTQAMSGVMLYYELATPTETAVDLDLAFNAYEDGTEQLLPVNGSVPSTSPVIADMTYLSIDDAMDYIIDKLANVPENTQHILDSLGDDVADLQTDVGELQPAVSSLQTSVGNINTNIGQLSSTVAGHTASISDMQSDITDLNTGLSDLEDTVTGNTSRIGTLETGLATTNGNVQSLSSQVQSIDGRVTNLESDLFKIVVKEFDYDTVAPETNFGTTTPITQEEGYRVIGVVGTEAQAGEYTSPASNIAITQCHIYYTSLGALTITIFGRNNGASSRTNVRIYAYLLCIKDIQ